MKRPMTANVKSVPYIAPMPKKSLNKVAKKTDPVSRY